jgi:choline-sulfatase
MKNSINRRQFVGHALAGAAAISMAPAAACGPYIKRERKPNILFINTDQQHFDALSAHGNPHVYTPHMDRLVKNGVTFRLSHTSNPVCGPARACWYTGRMPSEAGTPNNSYAIRNDLPNLRTWSSAQGYTEMYVGKYGVFYKQEPNHYPLAGHWLGEFSDEAISRTAQAFLRQYDGAKPFFLSLGIHQPHDICFWIMDRQAASGLLPYAELKDQLPPLPANFGYDEKEPETVIQSRKGLSPQNWSETDWRYYLWSYYRMVEMADAEIGRVLDTLADSKFAENTLVIFSSDHGEGTAHHKMTQKHYLYDEALRVPLVISWPGHIAQNLTDTRHLVSGVDFAPTVCDFAGLKPLPSMRGHSLRPLLEEKQTEWREFVVGESNVNGRALRTMDFKYITYFGEKTEQLFDMKNDAGETRNLALDAQYSGTLHEMKKLLAGWEAGLEKPELVRIS